MVAISNLVGNKQVQRSRIDNVVAPLPGTSDPRRLSLLFNLLRQVLAVAVGAEAVLALHRECFQVRGILTAYLAAEAGDSSELPGLFVTSS